MTDEFDEERATLLARIRELRDENERLHGLFVRLREEGHDMQCCKDLDDLVTEAIGPRTPRQLGSPKDG